MDESITVERVRHALVVGRLDTDGAAVLLAANLPPKRDRTFVVVGASSVGAMSRLDPWLVADLADEVHGDLCVVAPGFGSMGRDDTLPPARLLADRLGVEVTAADGHPVGLADGSMFVPGPTAGWVSFRPGGRRIRVGARLPAPWWQDGLPPHDDRITHVPAGLWVRGPGAPERPADPLSRRVPDPDRMYVVLGAPGEQPPDATAVTGVLRSLPDEGRDRAVLVWYGSGGGVDARARAVAAELGAPVRVAHGVPGDDGLRYVDEAGVARWRPFALESVYRPDGPPVLDRWMAPPALAMAEPGTYRLTGEWLVDVVPRGLIVRPASPRKVPVPVAAEAGATADILFVADAPVPAEVVTAIDRLVRALPEDTRQNLRIVPVGTHAETAAAAVEAADRVVTVTDTDADVAAADPARAPEHAAAVPAPVGAVTVLADGRVVPAAPILAVPPTRTRTVDIQDGVLVVPLADDDPPPAADLPASEASSVAPGLSRGGDTPVPAKASPVAAQVTAPVLGGIPVFPATATRTAPDEAAASGAAFLASSPGVPEAAPSPPEPIPAVAAVAAAPAVPPTVPAVMSPSPVPRQTAPAEEMSVATLPTTPPAGVLATAPSASTPSAVPQPVPASPSLADAGGTESVAGLLPGRGVRRAAHVASSIVEVPENVRSTAEQRRAMRAALGSRYDVATRAVTKLLSERPGLRFGVGDRAALLAELAVVRVFADDPDAPYDADFYVCLADGLRRLPTARAVVVRGIPADTDVTPGAVLRLPVPVIATSTAATAPAGPAEALIWTTTARRLEGLLDEPDRGSDVVLPGHTRLRVLAVEPDPVRRVLLAEDGTTGAAALNRLRAAAFARPESGAEPGSRWFGPLPAA
ncbi:hypothetical protein [Actinophytocola glycyrrhizae]|uniref:Uncharacterized protein n=1 Tax=Actinophytocola glycyrrhizae TaxID=2044873 RepID=A0ABV9RUM3_9PSEU